MKTHNFFYISGKDLWHSNGAVFISCHRNHFLGVNDMEQSHIKSVFKNQTITKEEYTHVWIELITQLEKKKYAAFFPQT